ncbi:MAG TPA: RHS repeat-associated core domain-containing protein [Candidatus Acidoferrum sp.]|nr:RHS repeat-associated core domain-containing protein [Candidatus Acidoferrum sp.]
MSLSNGSLGVDIPLISYPQRGGRLKLDFALHYFNAATINESSCYSGYGCYGWINYNEGGLALVDKGVVFPPSFGTYFGIQEFDGAFHLFGEVIGQTNLAESVDASAYQATLTSNSQSLESITDPLGTVYTVGSRYCYAGFPGSFSSTEDTGLLLGSCELSRSDTNGNSISFSSGTGWTDTLGRTVPLPTVSTSSSNFTGCTGSQPVSGVVLWSPPGDNGGTYALKFCFFTANYPTYTASCAVAYGEGYVCDYTASTNAITEIESVVLPNGTAWTFSYSNVNVSAVSGYPADFPTLSQITFPTGGTLSYTWTTTQLCWRGGSTPNNFAVASRTVNPNDGLTPSSTWNYNYASSATTGATTTVTDPFENDTVHTLGLPINGSLSSCYPYETQVQYFQGSHTSGSLLKTVSTTFSALFPNASDAPDWDYTAFNVVPTQVNTTWSNGQESQVSHTYDSGPFQFQYASGYPAYSGIYGKELARSEYDYGNGAPGALLRTTTTNYLAFNNSSYLAANLLDLRSSEQITDSGGTQRAYTTYNYDENNGSPQGVLGNLTSTHRWLNTNNTYLVTTNIYNPNGLVTETLDPKKTNPTNYGYSSSSCLSGTGYAGSGPTSVTNALNQTTYYCYDLTTGLRTSVKDPNSQTTTYAYDNMLRTTQINYPDTGQTNFAYATPNEVQITERMNTSTNRVSYLLVDGVGRKIRQAITNGETTPYDEADTCYDGNGRVSFESYPFQDTGPFGTSRNCGSSEAGDTFAYDALGRTTSVTHSDGTSVLTSYTGRATSIQDEGNGTQRVQRISQVDGLGRLASVCEVTSTTLTVGITGSTTPAACGQDISATGFLTTYAYDALDNLNSVTQGPLNARSFVYDSLSRLTSAANPEAGATAYTYDADGNVLTKTDARSIAITYTYDALNRLTSKTYSDGTPTASYSYDQTSAMGISLANTIGRKSSESTAGSSPTGSVFSYDSMGRVLNNSQCTPYNCSSAPFSVAYTYDLLGDVTSSTNGAGVTLTNAYNMGARLASVTSTYQGPTLLSGVHYNAAGSLVSATLGNGLGETKAYDPRLRLCSISDGSVYSLAIPSTVSGPCPSGSTNGYAPNSDILAANDSVNGNWTYGPYDAFNRLTGSNQNNGTTTYSYVYDRFGNRWQQSVTHGSGSSSSLGFDANNHITGITGVTFDAAGDTTGDGTTTYTYDAEGRITTASNSANGSSAYVYDAEGRRIGKTTVAGGTVDFVYDLAGHEIAQFGTGGGWNRGEVYAGNRHLATYNNGTTYFIHADWLGTERARSTSSGSSYETCIGLPFGDGLSCTTADVSPMHFTGKERDSETASSPGGTNGLDNFGARYDSSSFGRFMTPDWSAAADAVPYANFVNPQTLNLYSYVADNPETAVDADGHECTGYDGKQHNWVWCLFHETKAEYDKRINSEREWIKRNLLVDNKPVDPNWVNNLSAEDVDKLYGIGTQIQGLQQQNDDNSPPSIGGTPAQGATGQPTQGVMRDRPDWAKTPGGFVNWLKNLSKAGVKLSAADADEIVIEAKKLGVELRLDPPHPGTNWDVPHLNIGSNGQVHLEVPVGYSNPSVPMGSATRP